MIARQPPGGWVAMHRFGHCAAPEAIRPARRYDFPIVLRRRLTLSAPRHRAFNSPVVRAEGFQPPGGAACLSIDRWWHLCDRSFVATKHQGVGVKILGDRTRMQQLRSGLNGASIGARFITVLGRNADLVAWPVVEAELKKAGIFYSTNIEQISQGSIPLSGTDVLENIRNPRCVGILVFLSDIYFRFLDTSGGAEKAVVLDHLSNRRPSFGIVGAGEISDRPEFNIYRSRYNSERMEAFAQNFRDWLQGQVALSARSSVDAHPDILEILRFTFGPSVEDRSGFVNRGVVRYNLFSYQDPTFLSTRFILYLHPNITIGRTAEHFNSMYRAIVGDTSFLVLVDPKGVQNRESWIRTVRTNITSHNALFLDDFVKDRFQINIPQPDRKTGVVAPRLRNKADDSIIEGTFDFLLHELTSDSSMASVIVVNGQGGIGKTLSHPLIFSPVIPRQ